MIEADGLCKTYGSTPAIADITFRVEPGEILGFLGPNGAGKTTTMRILTGYLPATAGTARIAGFDIHEQSIAARQNIGYLPETPPLYPEMTVEGFLHFVARIKGVAAGDRNQRVDSALQRCNLSDRRRSLIRKLSKGYRQRVGIAQAIVHDPPVLVLDEPTVGLDPRQIIDVRNLIKSLAGNHTIILSTHILPEVSMTCSRVAIVNQGRVVATDPPDHLMAGLANSGGYELEIEGDPDEVLYEVIEPPTHSAVDSELPPAAELPAEKLISESEPIAEGDRASDETPETFQVSESDETEAVAPVEPETLATVTPRGRGAALVDRLAELVGDGAIRPLLIGAAAPSNRLRLRLRVNQPLAGDAGRAIAATVLGAGLGLCELRRDRVSLEEVFLQLTTQEPTAQ